MAIIMVAVATVIVIGFVTMVYSLRSSWSTHNELFQRQNYPDDVMAYNIAKDYKRVGSLYYDNTVDMLFKLKIIDEICFVNPYTDLTKIGKTVGRQARDHTMNGVGTAIILLKENKEVHFIGLIPGGLHDPSTKCYSSPPQN